MKLVCHFLQGIPRFYLFLVFHFFVCFFLFFFCFFLSGNTCFMLGGLTASSALNYTEARDACRALTNQQSTDIASITNHQQQGQRLQFDPHDPSILIMSAKSRHQFDSHYPFILIMSAKSATSVCPPPPPPSTPSFS